MIRPLTGNADDHSALLDRVGDARFVLLGESSHGTHDFYHQRAAITKRLIVEKGFAAVAVEADWPDAYRVNSYVRGEGEDPDANAALSGFERFPTWMWRNTVVLEFVDWLRDTNSRREKANRVGWFGLDLYSLFSSIEAVVEYLDRVDPEAAKRARYRYGCFEDFGEDSQAYGYAASFDLSRSCEDEAISQLVEMRRRGVEYLTRAGSDDFFAAEQNARLVRNAEEYYRSMFRGRHSSWNLRDTHMAETVDALVSHLERRGLEPKIVVWAHNSHLGDARATEMGRQGELNLGQLIRQKYEDAVLVGFTTYAGSVTAASNWDEPGERKRVRPGLSGSYESAFHDLGVPSFFLDLANVRSDEPPFTEPLLERAIGVIYRPDTERVSHYFLADIRAQFDAIYHFDRTQALEPLEKPERWVGAEAPETYPSGV
ncbi:MAG: erythromycin esterase family protein [Gemmatimonadaceae bacterium]